MAVFKEITNDNKLVQTYTSQNHEVWGGPFTQSQYAEYGKRVGEVAESHGLKERFFGMIEGDQLLAACSVLDRPLYVGKDQKLAVDHAIAGVHTPPQHRRKGYANQLIEGVVAEYKKDQEGQLSLWSDVGDYYARMGFKKIPEDHFASLLIDTKSFESVQMPSQFEWLDTPEKLESVRQTHDEHLKKYADERHGALTEATRGLYELNVAKGTLFNEIIGKPEPTKFGAKIGNAWATWFYIFGYSLTVIMGAEGTPEEIAELMKLAAKASVEYGVTQIEFYETSVLASDFKEVEPAAKNAGLIAHIEQPRHHMHPMFIGNRPWIGYGGYCWY